MLLSAVPLLLLAPTPAPAAQVAEDVDIYYDALMVPHVFAESDEGALYGLGYQHVRDNPIGTLDRMWRWSGRFAEVVGPSYLDEDHEIRLWQVPEVADRHLRTMPDDVRRMLEAYVRGIEDGRAWWREGNVPATGGLRLKELLGTVTDPDHVELNVDPLPDYLNQGFHPYQLDPGDPGDPGAVHPDYDPGDVPAYVTRVVDWLFDASNPVTLENLVRAGCVISSGRELLYRGNEIVTIPDDTSLPGGGSNAWMISSAATGGPTTVHLDPHTIRNNLRSRYYLVQVHGPGFQVTGMGIPGTPCLLAGGNDALAWTISNTSANIAVTKTSWTALLEDTPPLRFRFDGLRDRRPGRGGAVAQAFQELTRVRDVLRYFDPVATTDTDGNGTIDPGERVFRTQARTRWYVPADRRLGLPRNRHPVTRLNGVPLDGLGPAPAPGDTVRFEQSAFTVSAHPWVYYLSLGRARHVDDAPAGQDDVRSILERSLWSFTTNFQFASRDDRFYYVYKSKVPRQGDGVAARYALDDYARLQSGTLSLDGTRADERWQGFHTLDELPTIGPVTVSGPEVWINNNVTPDRMELGPDGADPADDRFDASDLAALPDEVLRPDSRTSWRQERAAALLQQASLTPGALAGRSETIGFDRADTWMLAFWDYFRQARDVKAGELALGDPDLADVDRLIAWVEEHRHLGEDGLTTDPALDMVAHEYALVTVYTTLLRSAYQNALALAGGLTEEQASLGRDALHPLFALGPAAFVRPDWSPNIDAMWQAFTGVAGFFAGTAPTWRAGSGLTGLRNQELLTATWALPAWAADPRYSDLQAAVDPNFAADMAGDHVTRWGHVKKLVLTPHLVAPGRAFAYASNNERLRGHVYAGLAPQLLATLGPDPFVDRLKFPVYQDQPVVAFPIGGVEDSLFVTANLFVFGGPAPSGSDQALYVWNRSPDDLFFHVPHEQGSQMLVSYELSPTQPLRVRTLVALGGTEITRTFRPWQDRYAPSRDFARGVWRTVELDQGVLAGANVHHVPLTFVPAP